MCVYLHTYILEHIQSLCVAHRLFFRRKCVSQLPAATMLFNLSFCLHELSHSKTDRAVGVHCDF